MRRLNFFIFIILVAVVAIPLFASAQILTGPIVPCGTNANPNDCTLCDLFVGTKNIINFLTFNIGAPVVVIALIIGGALLLTSGGSEERRNKGKSAITYAMLGLIVIFASWLIIDLILGNLIQTGPGAYWTWSVFPACPSP